MPTKTCGDCGFYYSWCCNHPQHTKNIPPESKICPDFVQGGKCKHCQNWEPTGRLGPTGKKLGKCRVTGRVGVGGIYCVENFKPFGDTAPTPVREMHYRGTTKEEYWDLLYHLAASKECRHIVVLPRDIFWSGVHGTNINPVLVMNMNIWVVYVEPGLSVEDRRRIAGGSDTAPYLELFDREGSGNPARFEYAFRIESDTAVTNDVAVELANYTRSATSSEKRPYSVSGPLSVHYHYIEWGDVDIRAKGGWRHSYVPGIYPTVDLETYRAAYREVGVKGAELKGKELLLEGDFGHILYDSYSNGSLQSFCVAPYDVKEAKLLRSLEGRELTVQLVGARQYLKGPIKVRVGDFWESGRLYLYVLHDG